MSKLKVVIITSGYLPIPAVKGGGVETLIDYLISENETQQELELTVFSSFDEGADLSAKKLTKCSLVFIKTPGFIRLSDKLVYWFSRVVLRKANPSSYRYILQRLAYIRKVGHQLATRDFDRLILENSATLFGVLKTKQNRLKYRGKYYFHMHNEVTNDFGYQDDIEKVNKVLGVSQYINSQMQQKYPEMKKEQFAVLKNGIDPSRFSREMSAEDRQTLRQRYGILETEVVFMFTGRIAAEKGLLEALQAFEKAELVNAKFLVIGSTFFKTNVKSSYHLKIEALATKLKDTVILAGFIPNDQLGDYYGIADVCVLPSIWDEPAGLTMIEAITAGKALVTTNSGGIPEYVPSESAIILDKNQATFFSELTETMKELAKETTKRNALEEQAINQRQSYSTEKMYQDFVKIIE